MPLVSHSSLKKARKPEFLIRDSGFCFSVIKTYFLEYVYF